MNQPNDRFEWDRVIHVGRVLELHDAGVRMPDGKVVQRDYVHYNGAAVILPVLADGSIVMIRNYRFAVGDTLWELPAGMIDGDEAPLSAATRELTEETGYSAGQIVKLGEFYAAPGSSDELMHAFLATDLKDGLQALETYEQIEVHVLSDATVRQMLRDGAIRDAKTVSALALYWLRGT